MKKWLFLLRLDNDLFFWEIFTASGGHVCHSTKGFLTEEEAVKDMREFHPVDHF